MLQHTYRYTDWSVKGKYINYMDNKNSFTNQTDMSFIKVAEGSSEWDFSFFLCLLFATNGV
jgi:hypothetical protein